MKTLLKVTAATAVVTAVVVAVRRLDLLKRGTALVDAGAEKAAAGAEWFTGKAVQVADRLLTEFAGSADPTDGAEGDQDETQEPAPAKSASIRFGNVTSTTDDGAGR